MFYISQILMFNETNVMSTKQQHGIQNALGFHKVVKCVTVDRKYYRSLQRGLVNKAAIFVTLFTATGLGQPCQQPGVEQTAPHLFLSHANNRSNRSRPHLIQPGEFANQGSFCTTSTATTLRFAMGISSLHCGKERSLYSGM